MLRASGVDFKLKITAKDIAHNALLVCAALVLSIFEGFLPAAAIPVPGIKLGLANIVILFALYRKGFGSAVAILIAKCTLAAIFGGGITSFAFSVCGGICATTVMYFLKKLDGKYMSIFGVSIAGAAAHGIGQIAASAPMLGTLSIIYYLPALLLSGIFTGALTGAICMFLFKRLPEKI